jgi:hypothetical protein
MISAYRWHTEEAVGAATAFSARANQHNVIAKPAKFVGDGLECDLRASMYAVESGENKVNPHVRCSLPVAWH